MSRVATLGPVLYSILSSLGSTPYSRSFLTFFILALTILNISATIRNNSKWLIASVPDSKQYASEWMIDGLQTVAMTPEESVHYRPDTNIGALEWATTLPHGKGVISLPNTPGLFRLAMFHQLECLDVIRSSMVERSARPSEPWEPEATHFCLNYLRQSVQCHTDTHLEMVRSEYGGGSVRPYTTMTDCKNWEQIWDASERNFDEWKSS